jgi:hypothetical protein
LSRRPDDCRAHILVGDVLDRVEPTDNSPRCLRELVRPLVRLPRNNLESRAQVSYSSSRYAERFRVVPIARGHRPTSETVDRGDRNRVPRLMVGERRAEMMSARS